MDIEGNFSSQDILNPAACASADYYRRAGNNEIKDVTLGFSEFIVNQAADSNQTLSV